MSFVKDCIKFGIGYGAIIACTYAGLAVGNGLYQPVCEAVNNKAEKFFGKFKSNE